MWFYSTREIADVTRAQLGESYELTQAKTFGMWPWWSSMVKGQSETLTPTLWITCVK